MRFAHGTATVLALLLAAASPAAPPIPKASDHEKVPDVPAVVKVKPGNFSVIRIGKDVQAVFGFDQTKCPLIKLSSDDGQMFYLVNPSEPGQYPVMFHYKDCSRGALCVIDAGNPTPPPSPVDNELRKRLRIAYGGDGGPTPENEDGRKLLGELYRQAAELVLAAETPEALLEQLRRATSALTDDRLIETRTVVAEEVGKILTLGMVFTDANRKQASELFMRLSVALEW